MLEFLLSIVDAKSFLDVMFTCKLELLLYSITMLMLAHFTYGCSMFLQHSSLTLWFFDNYLQYDVFRATCGLHLTEYYWLKV
jgi:hypothetical protein